MHTMIVHIMLSLTDSYAKIRENINEMQQKGWQLANMTINGTFELAHYRLEYQKPFDWPVSPYSGVPRWLA